MYRIVFDDGKLWALRIPYGEVRSDVECTVTTMRYVRRALPSVPVATVHAWSDKEDGDGVGMPYILLDWIDGKTLEWNANTPPLAARGKILAQLARHTADFLARTPIQSNTSSALAWMLSRIDNRFTRILTGDLSTFDPIDCLIYRAMAEEKYFIPSLDALPFPLIHTDLNPLNIIVDDNFNITGYVASVSLIDMRQLRGFRILDWDEWVCRVPMQCAVICPAMIAAGSNLPHDEQLRNDRLAFTEHFTSAIRRSDIPDDITVHLSSLMGNDELQIFQLSIQSKDVYAHWVTKYCVRNTHWVEAAARALEKYTLARPEMASVSEVTAVRLRLSRIREQGD